jgi:hypothetical protein
VRSINLITEAGNRLNCIADSQVHVTRHWEGDIEYHVSPHTTVRGRTDVQVNAVQREEGIGRRPGERAPKTWHDMIRASSPPPLPSSLTLSLLPLSCVVCQLATLHASVLFLRYVALSPRTEQVAKQHTHSYTFVSFKALHFYCVCENLSHQTNPISPTACPF